MASSVADGAPSERWKNPGEGSGPPEHQSGSLLLLLSLLLLCVITILKRFFTFYSKCQPQFMTRRPYHIRVMRFFASLFCFSAACLYINFDDRAFGVTTNRTATFQIATVCSLVLDLSCTAGHRQLLKTFSGMPLWSRTVVWTMFNCVGHIYPLSAWPGAGISLWRTSTCSRHQFKPTQLSTVVKRLKRTFQVAASRICYSLSLHVTSAPSQQTFRKRG